MARQTKAQREAARQARLTARQPPKPDAPADPAATVVLDARADVQVLVEIEGHDQTKDPKEKGKSK